MDQSLILKEIAHQSCRSFHGTFPCSCRLEKLAPALAAGFTVAMKTRKQTYISALRTLKIV
jgi:hypothetical protein